MLDTEGEEMNFEVARCRPQLTQDFFSYLNSQICERMWFCSGTMDGVEYCRFPMPAELLWALTVHVTAACCMSCTPKRQPKVSADLRAAAEERFAAVSKMDRLAELESLQEFLVAAVAALDETTAKAAAPAERVRKLLQAQDKKATLLEMAGELKVAHSAFARCMIACCCLAHVRRCAPGLLGSETSRSGRLGDMRQICSPRRCRHAEAQGVNHGA